MLKRALIVDDEPETRAFIAGFFNSNGIDTLILPESDVAVSHLWSEKFSLILFNFRRRPLEGVKLTAWIRKSGINMQTPIVLISGEYGSHTLLKGFEAGANFCLYGSIDRNQLVRLTFAAHKVVEDEQRRFQRIEIQSKALLTCDYADLECKTVDVSLSGLLVESPRIIPPGVCAKVAIHLAPEIDPILGAGSVVRIVGRNRMGIRLDFLDSAERKRLERFIMPSAPYPWPENIA